MLSKNVNNKKCAPNMVFFNEKKIINLDFFSIFLLEFMVSINSSFDLAKSSDAKKKEVGHDTKKI